MASLSTWEWVGDFVDIDKEYFQQTTLITELRHEGTRQRVVDGYSMSNGAI